MRELRRDLHEQNRRSWNAATRAHNAHKRDQAGYLRRGGSTLFPEELELLGNVEGRRILHLCCNSGQDSLSLVRLGAEVVGVDISDEAIAFARRLSEESGLDARFERADVYEWLDTAAERERFDVVFASYGALCWLSDLDRWARGAARRLVPGGRVVVMEFHPFSMIFDDEARLRFPYFESEPYTWQEGVGDYVGVAEGALSPSGHVEGEEPFANPHAVHEFLWTIADVVNALVVGGGLRLEFMREYPYANGCGLFAFLERREGRHFATPASMPDLPLMYGIVARS